ncbi:phage tail tape measure protein [Salinimicrobium sp. 3283s]|uniref:phage tail tape measure protein n=1 Tax=Salinimicrobium sp. 3283s TaxID=3114359 RepID=UPI0031F0034F
MAKRIVDEEMRFSIVINGNEAQKELYELERSTRKLTQENKDLRAEKARLKAQGKEESEEYRNLTRRIKENSLELSRNKARTQELQKEIGITGLTMAQLSKRASQLRLEMRNMLPGSAEYKRMQAELVAVNARMKELSLGAQQAEGSISRLAQGFNKYFILATSVIATGTGVVLSLQKVIDFNGKLSDSQADVMKTTGMTREEVDELTKSFGMMKTRTARIELLNLAADAGKLGVTGVKNLRDFVAEANKMKVALGDDLSDEQIKEVGKITDIYDVGTQTGKEFAGAMNAVGSAINEVSASGANAAPFLVDYLKRQAGIAKQAKIGADQNIGYAATFDEIGQSVEVSATAMNKVWMDIFDDPATYAKVAKMELRDFNNLLQTDSNEAMIRFLEGLNGNNEGLAVMVEKLKDIDVGGARGAQALSALAGSTDKLREKQKLANQALIEATSLTDEYNIKNNNFAATIDKINKKVMGWFASEAIVSRLESWAVAFAKFIGATEDASGEVDIWRERLLAAFKVLLVLVAAVLSYKAAIQLSALWTARASAATRIHYALLVAQEIATKSLAIAKALLTGNIRKAVVAYRALTAAMALNPIGAAVAVVGGLVAAYYAFSESAEKAATAQSILNDAHTEAIRTTRSEINEINGLLAVARDEKISKQERIKAINRLNEISPEYLGNLSLENINTQEATTSLDAYVESLVRAAKAKALKAQLDAKSEELAKAEGSSLQENIKWYEKLWNSLTSLNDPFESSMKNYQSATENKNKWIEATKEELKLIEEQYKAQLKENAQAGGNNEPKGPKEGDTQVIGEQLFRFTNGKWMAVKTPGPKDDPGGKKAEYKVDPKKEEAELRRIQEENDKLKATLISDSFQKEIALSEANHAAKMQKLREQMIEEAEILNLDLEIDKAKASGDSKKVDQLSKTKEIWMQRNKELNDQMLYEEELHQLEIGKLIQKGLEEDFQEKQKAFDRETVLRETAHNNAMAALGNNEAAKKALQEKFNQEESVRQENHLRELIAEMNAIIKGGSFEGFDLELLSPEQKQALLDFLDQANLKLSDLLNKMSSAGNGNDPSATGDFASGVDILGMSPDQWIAMFDNLDTTAGKIEAAQFAVQSMLGAWSMYSDYMNKREQIELRNWEQAQEKKKESLSRQLDAGYINHRQYNAAVEAMEKEAARKKAELEYKAAKRERSMNLAQAASGTALAVINALQTKPFLPMGLIMASVAGAMGLAQMTMIASTPLPAKGFEKGLYPVQREQDGKMFNASYGGETRSGLVDKPTLFLAGEGGKRRPEMIIDDRAWAKMDPDVKNSVYRELGRLGRVPGYEGGYYSDMRKVEDVPSGPAGGDSPDYILFVKALDRNSAVMERLETSGLPAYLVRNMENTKKIRDDLKDYDNLRNENKK